jgi:hypothetical protein
METSLATSGKFFDVQEVIYREACFESRVFPPVYDVSHHSDIDALILLQSW